MDDIKTVNKLSELHQHFLDEIRHVCERYLDKHLTADELAISSEWERDKKSLIVFFHAALENYIEMLSITLIDYGVNEYKFNNRITDILLCFVWLRTSKPSFSEDEWDDTTRCLLKKDIADLADSFKNEIYKNNHGIKVKNLNNLLRTVGVDLPQSSEITTSLDTLTNLRGEFAHRFLEKGSSLKRIQNTSGPEEIQTVILNSYRLAYRLYIRSLSKISGDKSLTALKNEYIKLESVTKAVEGAESSRDSIFSVEVATE